MFWLALIGLAITAAGTVLGAVGQAQANEQQMREKELEAQQLKDSLAIYAAQKKEAKAELADISADRLAAEKLNTLSGISLAEQASGAEGAIRATAGVGNLGGESVLRQADRVETLYQREKTKLSLQYEDTMRGLKTRKLSAESTLLTSGLQSKWAEEKSTMAQEEADWLRDYGWMSVLGVGLKGAGAVVQGIGNL